MQQVDARGHDQVRVWSPQDVDDVALGAAILPVNQLPQDLHLKGGCAGFYGAWSSGEGAANDRVLVNWQ